MDTPPLTLESIEDTNKKNPLLAVILSKPPSHKQCVQAIYNCRRPALSWRNSGRDIIGFTRKANPVFDCEFQLSDSTKGQSKALVKKGKKSYRPYFQEHVYTNVMDLIKKEEPLEGFKGRKVEPREPVPDEDSEEVSDTNSVYEMRCKTFAGMLQADNEKPGKNSEEWYSESGRSWYIFPGPLERWNHRVMLQCDC